MDNFCCDDNITKVGNEVSKKKKPTKRIEKASQILESFGPFQIYSIIMFCPIYAMMGMTIIIPVFLNIVPDHHCQQNIWNNTVSSNPTRLCENDSSKKSLIYYG